MTIFQSAMKCRLIFLLLAGVGVNLAKHKTEEKHKSSEDFSIPYLVYLQSSPEPCVGSLIHPQWVLTAAHCPTPVKIRLGVDQPSMTNKKEQARNCSLAVRHPAFNAHSLENDVMLVKLNKAAAINSHVGTIAIAMESLSFNESCFIPTWTWNEYKNISDPDILTWTTQYINPSHVCIESIGKEIKTVPLMCVGTPVATISANKFSSVILKSQRNTEETPQIELSIPPLNSDNLILWSFEMTIDIMMKPILSWAFLHLPVVLAFDPELTNGFNTPYLAYLKSDYLPCVGVLIHPLWVLTAAHCNLPRLSVVLGVTNPSNPHEKHLQKVGYEKIIYHPRFSVMGIDNDLLLIKLKQNIRLNAYVNLVRMPTEPASVYRMCTVSTWAYNSCEIMENPNSLQHVNISVISNFECRGAYESYSITDKMMCVGIVPGRRRPCKELTGAPAICDGKLQGILAFADGCVLRADVGIYTKIIDYIPWIENVIRTN